MPFKYNPFSDEMDYYADTLPTIKLTDLTDGYVPYHVSDATGLADSPMQYSSSVGTILAFGISPFPTTDFVNGTTLSLGRVADAEASRLEFYRAKAGPSVTTDGQEIGRINARVFDGTNYEQAASILFRTVGVPVANNVSGKISFLTSNNTQVPSEKAYIDPDGTFYIGSYIVGSRIAVGGYYFNSTGVDPNTELGYGTWTQVAQGQFLVGAA
jgi:hypothetical protein